MKGKIMKKEIKEIEKINESLCENICEEEDSCVSVEYDLESFDEGVKSMSKFCGRVAALINLGVTPDNALSYFAHKLELATSKQITEIESNCHIECAKNANLQEMDEDL